jgi:hypothetical protein
VQPVSERQQILQRQVLPACLVLETGASFTALFGDVARARRELQTPFTEV